MNEKYTEMISVRVTPLLKHEYETLNEEAKKHLKKLLLNDLAKFCWSQHHYDKSFYFDEGET
jgi:hypothetical protein